MAPVYIVPRCGLARSEDSTCSRSRCRISNDSRRAAIPHFPHPSDVDRAHRVDASAAKHPVIFVRSRFAQAWMTGSAALRSPRRSTAKSITDKKSAAAFPTNHPLHAGPEGKALEPESNRGAQSVPIVIINLDYERFRRSSLRNKRSVQPRIRRAKIVSASLDRYVHNGWSMDHQALPPADLDMIVDRSGRVRRRRSIAKMGIGTVSPRSNRRRAESAARKTPRSYPDPIKPGDDSITPQNACGAQSTMATARSRRHVLHALAARHARDRNTRSDHPFDHHRRRRRRRHRFGPRHGCGRRRSRCKRNRASFPSLFSATAIS